MHREAVPALLRHIHRALKPGAITVHQIGIDDHMAHYDWIDAVKGAGVKLVERVTEATTLEGLRISPSFSRYSREDLACTIATLVLQRC